MSSRDKIRKGKPVAFRVTDETLARIDEQVGAMRARAPGLVISRSDVVRYAIQVALRSQHELGFVDRAASL